jgi:hypothetical protein
VPSLIPKSLYEARAAVLEGFTLEGFTDDRFGTIYIVIKPKSIAPKIRLNRNLTARRWREKLILREFFLVLFNISVSVDFLDDKFIKFICVCPDE